MKRLIQRDGDVTAQERSGPVHEEVFHRVGATATHGVTGSHGWVEVHAGHVDT